MVTYATFKCDLQLKCQQSGALPHVFTLKRLHDSVKFTTVPLSV